MRGERFLMHNTSPRYTKNQTELNSARLQREKRITREPFLGEAPIFFQLIFSPLPVNPIYHQQQGRAKKK